MPSLGFPARCPRGDPWPSAEEGRSRAEREEWRGPRVGHTGDHRPGEEAKLRRAQEGARVRRGRGLWGGGGARRIPALAGATREPRGSPGLPDELRSALLPRARLLLSPPVSQPPRSIPAVSTAIRVPQRARGGALRPQGAPSSGPGQALVGARRRRMDTKRCFANKPMTTRAACWRAGCEESGGARWSPPPSRILQELPPLGQPGAEGAAAARPAAASGDCTAAWPRWPTCSTTSRRARSSPRPGSATCARPSASSAACARAEVGQADAVPAPPSCSGAGVCRRGHARVPRPGPARLRAAAGQVPGSVRRPCAPVSFSVRLRQAIRGPLWQAFMHPRVLKQETRPGGKRPPAARGRVPPSYPAPGYVGAVPRLLLHLSLLLFSLPGFLRLLSLSLLLCVSPPRPPPLLSVSRLGLRAFALCSCFTETGISPNASARVLAGGPSK